MGFRIDYYIPNWQACVHDQIFEGRVIWNLGRFQPLFVYFLLFTIQQQMQHQYQLYNRKWLWLSWLIGPRFESSHRRILLYGLFVYLYQLYWKDQIKEIVVWNGLVFKNYQLYKKRWCCAWTRAEATELSLSPLCVMWSQMFFAYLRVHSRLSMDIFIRTVQIICKIQSKNISRSILRNS